MLRVSHCAVRYIKKAYLTTANMTNWSFDVSFCLPYQNIIGINTQKVREPLSVVLGELPSCGCRFHHILP